MPRSTTQLAIGAVIALGMAIVGLSATGTPLNVAQTLVIWDKPLLSETDAQVSDRERLQLRRHFSQERRDWILRKRQTQPREVAVSKAPLRAPGQLELPHFGTEKNMPALYLHAQRDSWIGIAIVVAIGLIWSVAVMSKLVPVDGSEMSSPTISRPAE